MAADVDIVDNIFVRALESLDIQHCVIQYCVKFDIVGAKWHLLICSCNLLTYLL
jgi:hypothetical protein